MPPPLITHDFLLSPPLTASIAAHSPVPSLAINRDSIPSGSGIPPETVLKRPEQNDGTSVPGIP
ncbi:hypothetical protein F2Q70_00003993 [Brassica cretica]|uniref:Uncharacterized protein n=1 Tax=Brassica cretica TaxID=69181 RepID=A0A3N6RTH3_BRACR|nr:hypothetical protein F2Q70_00003993 [Brassica cretica]KAF3562279.1 hypothetical protein DY000_02015923 [Brassica cretica]